MNFAYSIIFISTLVKYAYDAPVLKPSGSEPMILAQLTRGFILIVNPFDKTQTSLYSYFIH